MSTLKVNALRHNSASSDGVTLHSDGTAVMQVNGGMNFRNRIINGAMVIDQRNAGASISVAAATPSTYFPVDRFFCQSTGTAFTAQRVTGSGSFKNALRLTGAASNTGAYTTQRIESLNTYDLVSQSVTLSAVLSRSSGTTCTWTAYYANTTDTFSSVTSIATGTFTLSSTATTYSATFNAGANAGNGIMIEFTWGALGAGVTVDITGVQLEVGSVATPFERRPYGTELALCQRYFIQSQSYGVATSSSVFFTNYIGLSVGANNWLWHSVNFPVTMRVAPSVTTSDFNGATGKISIWTSGGGGNTSNITAYSLYASRDAFSYSDYSNAKFGVGIGGYIASAEL